MGETIIERRMTMSDTVNSKEQMKQQEQNHAERHIKKTDSRTSDPYLNKRLDGPNRPSV
jgi:hypothetical protein